MKVQRLIEKYKKLEGVWNAEGAELARQIFLQDLEQLDEPEKIKVPPIVSVWYQINKDNLYKNIAYLCANWVKSTTDDALFNWMSNTDNFIQILVNMHQLGYEVEKEKRYHVKINGEIEENLLVYGLGINRYFFARTYDSSKRNGHTLKELEDAGFGWVFDCPGIEIEEVE